MTDMGEPTYYSKGKDCEFYEELSDKDFAWEAAQDLADMNTRGLEDILPFVGVLSIAADRVEKLSASTPPTGWRLPSWWKPSQKLSAALNAYRQVKADFEAFDGDRRGIGAAMSERAFAIIDVIAKEHFENDDSDNNYCIVSRMVEGLIANLPPAAGYSDVK